MFLYRGKNYKKFEHYSILLNSTNNYMNRDDFEMVLASIPELHIRKWKDEDVSMLFKILYWCALRPIEGIKLSKEDFNLNNRMINLGKTKTQKNAVALIPVRFIEEMQNYLYSKEPGRLLPDLTYDTFYRWLKRLGVMLDIPAWVTPQIETGEKTVGHIFRKSIGKAMLTGEIRNNQGNKFDIPVISKHLRHKKPSITVDHYLKASIAQVSEQF